MDYLQIARENLRKNRESLHEALMLNRMQYCSKCNGKMHYLYSGIYECEKCGAQAMDEFGKVKNYIEIHGPSSAYEISEATGVDLDTIDFFLKQGRVQLTEDSRFFLQCEMCGADITYGRICAKCAKKSEAVPKGYCVMDVGEEPLRKRRSSESMHYLNRENMK